MPTESNSAYDKNEFMLAYLCVKDLSTLRQKVNVLDRFKFSGPQIARICGCTEQAVRDARHDLKTSASKPANN